MKAKNDPNSPYYRDPRLPEPRIVKSHSCSTIIAEVLVERGISYAIHKPDIGEDFVVIHFDANQADYRAARIEWLQRMSVQILPNETKGGSSYDTTAEKARQREPSDPACASSIVTTEVTEKEEGLFA